MKIRLLVALVLFFTTHAAPAAEPPVPWQVEAARLLRGSPVDLDGWEGPAIRDRTNDKSTGDALHANLLGAFAEGPVAAVVVSGTYAFVGSGGRLEAIDASDPDNPLHLDYLTLPEPPRDLAFQGARVYVACGESGLRIVDASVPAALNELGSFLLCDAAEGVAVEGEFAFVAAGDCGLRVIDVSVVAAPVEVGFLDTPGYASDVVVQAGTALVADGSGGLSIIDVSTPSAPVELGNGPTPGDVLRVAVDDDLAYLACGQDGFHVMDVADPAFPVVVGNLFGVAAADVAVGTSSVFVANSYLGMITVDVSVPVSPQWVGSHFSAGLVDAVAAAGDLAFAADNREGLRLVDCSVPAAPAARGLVPAGGVASSAVTMDGEIVYLAAGYAGVRVLDTWADPWNPLDLGTGDCGGHYAGGLALRDGLLLVAARTGGLRMFDVSDPVTITPVGTFTTGGLGYKVAAAGDVAFLADGSWGLHVIDITDPGAAFTLADMDTLGTVWDVRTDDTDVCAVTTGEFLVLDAADPAQTTVVGRLPVAGNPLGLALQDGMAYVATWTNGLRIIDYSTPTAPVEVGSFTAVEGLQDVEVLGRIAYLAGFTSGIRMVDIRRPFETVERGNYDTGGTAYGLTLGYFPVGLPDLTADFITPPTQVYVADGFNGLQIVESWAAVVDVPPPAPAFATYNYPNPFNPRTVIAFDLARPAEVDLGIYDVAGRLVRTALSRTRMGEGRRTWTWNGADDGGRAVAAGVYLYEVKAGQNVARGRMTLIR